MIFGKQLIQSYLSRAKAYNHTDIHSSLSQNDVLISNMQPGKNNLPLLYSFTGLCFPPSILEGDQIRNVLHVLHTVCKMLAMNAKIA